MDAASIRYHMMSSTSFQSGLGTVTKMKSFMYLWREELNGISVRGSRVLADSRTHGQMSVSSDPNLRMTTSVAETAMRVTATPESCSR